ncbi:hypothetical protein O6H91_10G104700 [Diphasiastrum complanatum]|uniref:Uncharacterized protein n=1 Tax=Diphasiastrum complanatum TaxID=34168 RepID=A0ACC2CK82_DIPCM|nr:hypothetical protein O6H91_10G104700 [Diphasiastrum complanatum]
MPCNCCFIFIRLMKATIQRTNESIFLTCQRLLKSIPVAICATLGGGGFHIGFLVGQLPSCLGGLIFYTIYLDLPRWRDAMHGVSLANWPVEETRFLSMSIVFSYSYLPSFVSIVSWKSPSLKGEILKLKCTHPQQECLVCMALVESINKCSWGLCFLQVTTSFAISNLT